MLHVSMLMGKTQLVTKAFAVSTSILPVPIFCSLMHIYLSATKTVSVTAYYVKCNTVISRFKLITTKRVSLFR